MISTALLAAGSSGGSGSVSWWQAGLAAVAGGLLVSLSNIFSARSNRKSAKEVDERRAASDVELAKVKAASDLALARAKAAGDEQLALNAAGRDAAMRMASTAFFLRSGQIGSVPEQRRAFGDAVVSLQMYCGQPIVKAGIDLALAAISHSQAKTQVDADKWDRIYHKMHTDYLNAVRKVFNLGDLPPLLTAPVGPGATPSSP